MASKHCYQVITMVGEGHIRLRLVNLGLVKLVLVKLGLVKISTFIICYRYR